MIEEALKKDKSFGRGNMVRRWLRSISFPGCSSMSLKITAPINISLPMMISSHAITKADLRPRPALRHRTAASVPWGCFEGDGLKKLNGGVRNLRTFEQRPQQIEV